MITAIVIPDDLEQPLRQEQISPADVDAYRNVVDGPLQVVTFDRPRACLYVNEEGKLEMFSTVNARATALTWVHNSLLRGHDVIVGNVLLVGPPDGAGYDTSVPDEYAELLFTARAFKVEVQVHGDEAWYSNEQVFGDVFDAYVAGIELARRWTQVVHVRVVPVRAG